MAMLPLSLTVIFLALVGWVFLREVDDNWPQYALVARILFAVAMTVAMAFLFVELAQAHP